MTRSSFEHTTPEQTRRYEAPKPPEAGSSNDCAAARLPDSPPSNPISLER